jgi:hypothetical protein
MSNEKPRRPNAYQHGVFARTTIVPGEDIKEFEALYSDLIQEWTPTGATEEDAVLSIAKAIWRKRRAQRFLEIQVARNSADPLHPSYNESLGLIGFNIAFRAKPAVAFEQFANRFLPVDTIKYLTQKFPRSDFQSIQEWAEAVSDEIESVMLPETLPESSPMRELALLSLSSLSLTDDFFDRELKLDERLDTMIDRAVKRLVQTKAMKQIFSGVGTDRAEDRVRKIAVKKASDG